MRVALVLLGLLSPTPALWLGSRTAGGPRMLAGRSRARRSGGGGKARGGGSGSGAARGFGAAALPAARRLDEEPEYADLVSWMNASPETNLRKVGVGDFDGLRGVMALEDIRKGEDIVSIPAYLAVDLGTGSEDPLPAAQRLLQIRDADAAAARPAADAADARGEQPPPSRMSYWRVLPPPDSPDLCTADFFSEKELQMLQWPPLVSATRRRSAALRKALGEMRPSGDTPTELMSAAGGGLRELRWAVWLVLSRVLTVLGPDTQGHKLLIPFMDLFNHRGGCKHYLTGRTDGMLRLVAGEPVKAGEQIHIVYGDATTSTVDFLSHYGFISPDDRAAAAADRALVRAAPEMVPALSHSSREDDEALLAASPPPPYQEQLALRMRIALKRAAAKEGLL